MDGSEPDRAPDCWATIEAMSNDLGFDMPSDRRTGALLTTIAASKPGGRFLELGTGTGLSTACLLAGMDGSSHLVSVDIDDRFQQIARTVLGADPRVTFELRDGLEFIESQAPASFDMIFADAWPGKYDGLDETLALVRPGGFYIADDMTARPSWSDDHRRRARELTACLSTLQGWATVAPQWGSGFIIAVKRSA